MDQPGLQRPAERRQPPLYLPIQFGLEAYDVMGDLLDARGHRPYPSGIFIAAPFDDIGEDMPGTADLRPW
jgi:hypothetical protein